MEMNLLAVIQWKRWPSQILEQLNFTWKLKLYLELIISIPVGKVLVMAVPDSRVDKHYMEIEALLGTDY